MIMYIDENGNLSKTPIDMSQRREIDPDTIQLGATSMPDPMRSLQAPLHLSATKDTALSLKMEASRYLP